MHHFLHFLKFTSGFALVLAFVLIGLQLTGATI